MLEAATKEAGGTLPMAREPAGNRAGFDDDSAHARVIEKAHRLDDDASARDEGEREDKYVIRR